MVPASRDDSCRLRLVARQTGGSSPRYAQAKRDTVIYRSRHVQREIIRCVRRYIAREVFKVLPAVVRSSPLELLDKT